MPKLIKSERCFTQLLETQFAAVCCPTW